MRALLPLCALALLLALVPRVGHARPTLQEQPPVDDALIAPSPAPGLSSVAGDQRGPSQYLAGKVAVRLVLPESDGSAEPSTESWTAQEIAQVTAETQAALNWWGAQLPLAGLSFALRVDVVPTAYEPIKHGLADEGLWISDSLRHLGYDGPSYFDQTYAAGYAHRDASGADWTTTIFVADSSAHPGGYFNDGRFAYAYINGPLMVITSDVGGYGASRMAPVIAHEFGHLFGALDQYAAARISCERRSGYLNTPTGNSQYGGCGTREPSIMLEPIGAYAGGQIDASARAQVGYRDGDGDGLIDPLDTAPRIELAAGRLASDSGRPILSGSARDLPYPAPLHQRVTLNTIATIEYRINGGPWLPLAAEDGAFDEAEEAFTAVLPLYDGDYAVDVRARNSAGAASVQPTAGLTISWLGPQPAYNPTTAPIVSSPRLRVSLEAPAGTSAVQLSERPAFDDAVWQPYAPELPFALAAGDGAYTLFVRFMDGAGRDSLPFALSVTLDTCPPVGTAARDPGSATALLLRAHDETTGVAAVELQVGAGPAVWQPFTPRVELGADSAGAPVTLRFRDGAGNISAPYTAPDRYQVALPLILR